MHLNVEDFVFSSEPSAFIKAEFYLNDVEACLRSSVELDFTFKWLTKTIALLSDDDLVKEISISWHCAICSLKPWFRG